MKIRDELIKAGVNNLREFGYLDCDEQNILKHSILKAFFVSMLKDNLGKNKLIDIEIKQLLEELK